MSSKKTEILVGLFILIGIGAFALLSLKVAGLSFSDSGENYTLYAKFSNVGGLKERSPIKVGGVVVGRVDSIILDPEDYTPQVTLHMNSQYGYYPETSSVSILTSGILGEQYIGLQPGFIDDDVEMLKNGDKIADTKPAIVLEDLIGQFLYSVSKD